MEASDERANGCRARGYAHGRYGRMGGSDRRDLVRAFPPERRGGRSKSPALGIGEAEPVATELGCEDAVFREEVGDDLLLLTLEPASNDRHQELEDHRRSSAWRQ
jgi:hypothetical protein